jgi:predicted RNA-binding Zn-ribbon protein involved in translation (DUF1610 family)
METTTRKPRICFTPECGAEISAHMPFCREHMAAKPWTCEMHGAVTTGDCPKCDDEMIAGLS